MQRGILTDEIQGRFEINTKELRLIPYARFDISLFPNKKIRQIEDDNGKVIKWHDCLEFAETESEDVPDNNVGE